jgi:hypothetical protein
VIGGINLHSFKSESLLEQLCVGDLPASEDVAGLLMKQHTDRQRRPVPAFALSIMTTVAGTQSKPLSRLWRSVLFAIAIPRRASFARRGLTSGRASSAGPS